MTGTIQLVFQNRSNDDGNSAVYIFQRNVVASPSELPVAWTVIERCGKGDSRRLNIGGLQVAVTDTYNNMTEFLDAAPGQAFELVLDPYGAGLRPRGPATVATEVQVYNGMSTGAISAGIYRSGNLLAHKSGVHPGGLAAFAFAPVILVGAAPQVVKGEVLSQALLTQHIQEFSLAGIASATVAMYGGGDARDAMPLTFSLEDVVYR